MRDVDMEDDSADDVDSDSEEIDLSGTSARAPVSPIVYRTRRHASTEIIISKSMSIFTIPLRGRYGASALHFSSLSWLI